MGRENEEERMWKRVTYESNNEEGSVRGDVVSAARTTSQRINNASEEDESKS